MKTRLAEEIGKDAAAQVYRALAELVLEATSPVPGEYERLVFFDPPGARQALREWLPGVSLRAQSAGDLGDRLARAFDRAFTRGARRVVAIGSDAPLVSRETVGLALEGLAEADVVLGPARDGGYYLIALGAPRPELLRGIDWGTPRVLEQTLERAAAEGLAVRQLEPIGDVDTLADLRREWTAIAPRLAGRPELARALARSLALPG